MGSSATPASSMVDAIDKPSSSSPASRAAIASMATDMPTRSAPKPRSMRVSAPVCTEGPGISA